MKILYVVNDAWFFKSHRIPIAIELVKNGHEVHLAARTDDSVELISSLGITVHSWNVKPRSKNVLSEVIAIASLARILLTVQPNLVHLVTIKPVIYGGILSRVLRIGSVVYAISGLGSILRNNNGESNKASTYLLNILYNFALGHNNSIIIFQNKDDRTYLHEQLNNSFPNSILIDGSGVNLDEFKFTNEPNDTIQVCMVARLLKDKGIREFCEAAKIVNASIPNIEFIVAGDFSGAGNPSSFTVDEINRLENTSGVRFIGHCHNIKQLYAKSNIVVHPSYHEGMPKTLLEAAASGRATITTDVPGCRDAIIDKKTGLLVPAKNYRKLANTILELLNNSDRRKKMGLAGRALAERKFDVNVVVRKHLAIYKELHTSQK